MTLVVIAEFRGSWRFLSNFWVEPFHYTSRFGVFLVRSAEHAYQAEKTTNLADFRTIITATTPGEAKRLGRVAIIRSDWEDVKVDVMKNIVTAKFKSSPDLSSWLIATGDAQLVEGNHWHDNFWGDCYCESCVNVPGHNELGKVLMRLREEIREAS